MMQSVSLGIQVGMSTRKMHNAGGLCCSESRQQILTSQSWKRQLTKKEVN